MSRPLFQEILRSNHRFVFSLIHKFNQPVTEPHSTRVSPCLSLLTGLELDHAEHLCPQHALSHQGSLMSAESASD
jgi:hypothetical protein